jgi:hypothetical protein
MLHASDKPEVQLSKSNAAGQHPDVWLETNDSEG